MPFAGVSKSKTAKLDKCVKDVMSGKDFKKKYSHKNAKSVAIAICRKAMKV